MSQNVIKKTMIVLVLLAVSLYFVAGTYARYASTASGDATVNVAKWAVKINGKDVSKATQDIALSFTEVENANVVDGFIAPASKLYADFKIDPTGSQVALDYDFTLGTIQASAGTVPESIAIEKVVKIANDGTETEIEKADGKYKGEIALASQSAALTDEQAVTVRVYLQWTNPATDDATVNATDTAFGAEAPTLTMNVTANVQQHI